MAVFCRDESCPAREYELSLKTAQLENTFQNTLSQLQHLFDSELDRTSRVDRLLLAADNDSLRLRCAQANNEISGMVHVESLVRQQLLEAHHELSILKASLRSNSKKIQDLKNELTSQNRKLSEHETASAKRLGITKEMSNLQSEVDRLRNQNNLHQALLAEKMALERQLNSLEVQIENERRAFTRIKLHDSRRDEEEMRLQSQLEKLQSEISKEISERQRLERENNERTNRWEDQKRALENRLENLRKKLRSTKGKLKEAQSELQKAPAFLEEDKASNAGSYIQNISLGRGTSSFDPDMTVATPGAVQATSVNKRSSTLPGDKSAFSITPYLRRTNTALDTSSISANDAGGHATQQSPDQDVNSDHSENRKGLAGGSESRDTSRDSLNNDEEPVFNELARTKSMGPSVRFLEENGASISSASSLHAASMQERQKQKKRRLLGSQRERTLFDEVDELSEGVRNDKKPAMNQNSSRNRAQFLNASSRGFGASLGFSPLKRDKRNS